jgi:outer membrane receptor for ferrienterochelin and colicin
MKRSTQTAALLLWALLLACGWAGTAAAQGVTTATVAGTVTGPGGAPVAGASVTARNTATGASRSAVTDASGRYAIGQLPPGGPYTVSATRVGFTAATRSGITLALKQVTRVDLAIAEQAVTLEGITATGQQNPALSPSRTGASTVVSSEEIESIPTITRNFTDVAVLSPHVQVAGNNESASIGGANNRFNNIQIDGAVSNDIFGLASSGVPGGQANAKPVPLDAIAQFQVLVAPFDVRQSGFTGGLINAVTKSGTNQLRGSAFALFRNQDFVQDRIIAGRDTLEEVNEFLNRQFGVSLGGPIVRDRAHFFLAGEFEQRRTPLLYGTSSDPVDIRVLPGRFAQVEAAAEGYGLALGTGGIYAPENTIGNILGRIDYRFSDDHRLVLRHSYSPNNFDDDPFRGGSGFEYSSATYEIKNRTNNSVLQLFSDFGSSLSNELFVNVQRITDRRTPLVSFPLIDVNTRDTINGVVTSGRITFGAERSSQANELDQDLIEVTDNLVWRRGAHTLTLGGQGIWQDFRNLFVQTSIGYYRFASPEAFAAGTAERYEIAVPVDGQSLDDVTARFGVFQAGGWLQDEWQALDNLTVTLGLRVDVPFTLDEPRDNPVYTEVFGGSTTRVPSGNALFSPRLGFNWQFGGAQVTQVRGGVGLFTGRLPYVWLSNAFGNTGRETLLLTCTGANTPDFTPLDPPTTCRNGATAAEAPQIISTFDEDFKYPQDLKFSLAIDRELPFGFTGTLEGLYTRAVNQLYVEEMALAGAQAVSAGSRQGIGDREIYGLPVVSPDSGFAAVREDSRIRNVVNMTNTDRGYSYALSAELQRSFGETFDIRGAYTYSRSYDVQSLTSSVATSNFGFAPAGRSIYDRPTTLSAFDRPHKVLLSGTWRGLPQYGGTEVSAVYVGQSGRAYTYTYDGDVNGDGYPGPGGLSGRNNDLIYVPATEDEVVFATEDDKRLFFELVEKEECLRESRGQILERNSCRAPWVNRMDVHAAQGLPGRFSNLKLEVNVFNFLNLLNREWGLQRGPSNNTVTLLDLAGRVGDQNTPMRFTYDLTNFTQNEASGIRRAGQPYTTFFESRYQVQLGLRVEF